MRFKKRVFSALVSLCMVLALLPVGAAAESESAEGNASASPMEPSSTQEYTVDTYANETEEWTEIEQLQRFDAPTNTAFFEDGSNYQILVQTDLNFARLLGHWFLCEITELDGTAYISGITLLDLQVDISFFISDLESDGSNFRKSGDGYFQSAETFEIPMTLVVTNTTPVPQYMLSEVEDNEDMILDVRSIELQAPSAFTVDKPEKPEKGLTLLPGEKWEYEGTIRADTSGLHIQNGNVTYTIRATVTDVNDLEFKGEGHFRVSMVDAAENEGLEYEGIMFPYLDKVTDADSAVSAVRQMTSGMTSEQRTSPTGIDLATLYAEAASAKAASSAVKNGQIVLNASAASNAATTASRASGAVETALTGGGITTARDLSKTVTFTTDDTKVSILVNPDILRSQADKIRIETPSYALTLKLSDLADDLKAPLTITAEEVSGASSAAKGVGAGFAPANLDTKTTVKITLPNAQLTNPVTISLPRDSGDTTYQAIVKTDGTATASKFNPATVSMDGKVNTSGTYTVKTNEKSFSDILNKSAEMQKAILYLTSKGIISGTSATTFSPDSTINRQQIAALIMRALGKVDNTATTNFTDVSSSSSLYRAIASSQRLGIINGYSDNTFRGTNVISKNQIVTVSGRVLTSEMNYKAPANTSTYLGKYKDTVPDYAKEMVALATREGLVVYRTDGTFSGDKNMTRGDAAIILYRLFQRIW